jgi:hypothetical protein
MMRCSRNDHVRPRQRTQSQTVDDESADRVDRAIAHWLNRWLLRSNARRYQKR